MKLLKALPLFFSVLLFCSCSSFDNISKTDIPRTSNISSNKLVDENITNEMIMTTVGASSAPTEPTSDKAMLLEFPTKPLRPFEGQWGDAFDNEQPQVEDLVMPWTEDLVWEAWFSLRESSPNSVYSNYDEYKYGDRLFRDLNNDGVDELILTQMDVFKMFIFSYDSQSPQLIGIFDNNDETQRYQELELVLVRGHGGSIGGYFKKLTPDSLNEIDFSYGFYDERGNYICSEDKDPNRFIYDNGETSEINEPCFNIYKGNDDLFYVTGRTSGNRLQKYWICQVSIGDNSDVEFTMLYRWGSSWEGNYGRKINPIYKYEKLIGFEEEPQFQEVTKEEIEDFLKQLYGDEYDS